MGNRHPPQKNKKLQMNPSTYCPCPACGKLNRVPTGETDKEPICGSCKATLPVRFGVVELSDAGLKKLVEKAPLPLICDFWAPWCGPCKMFAPIFQQAASRLAGQFIFAKINTEQHSASSGVYQVRGIPTLILFASGKEKALMSGAIPLDAFLSWIESHK